MMDTLNAIAKGLATQHNEAMVFDWTKAAQIIVERGAKEAMAGLELDFEWTGGLILADGKPVPAKHTYTYLASTWATPVLYIGGENIDCFRMESETPGWNEKTYWPNEAIAILESAESP